MSASVSVLSIDDVAPYSGPHAIEGIGFRALRGALGVSSRGMNVLDLEPHCAGHPTHDHQQDGQEEVYVVLSGEVFLLADGEEHRLVAGATARVGPAVQRQLVTRESGARILALGGTPGAVFQPNL